MDLKVCAVSDAPNVQATHTTAFQNYGSHIPADAGYSQQLKRGRKPLGLCYTLGNLSPYRNMSAL